MGSESIEMKKAKYRIVFQTLVVAIAAMAVFRPVPIWAADAMIHLRNRMMPLYIQNIQIQYVQRNSGQEVLILLLTEQQKYMSFTFDQIRKVDIIKFVGYRKEAPVFQVDVHLVEAGHRMKMFLMPITMLSGLNHGVPWKYKLNLFQGYDDNVQNLKAIEFIQPSGQ